MMSIGDACRHCNQHRYRDRCVDRADLACRRRRRVGRRRGEGAVPEGPVNLPTAFNTPIELGFDVELDEVYSQERRAWAEAQRNDPALRTLFSHAHGIHQKSKSIQKREPSIDSDGRLFVAFGHDDARRLVVPSERISALIGATLQQLDHRSADATCAELQKAFWGPACSSRSTTGAPVA